MVALVRKLILCRKDLLNNLTLKALANFSPGLRFGNPGVTQRPVTFVATLKELRPLDAIGVLAIVAELASYART